MTPLFLDPRESLVDRVADLVPRPDGDCSRTLVVFPGARPKYFLRRRLAELHGGPLVPPAVHTPQSLADRLYTADPDAPPLVDPFDACAILRDLFVAHGVFSGAHGRAASTLSTARVVYRELEHVRAGLAGLDRLRGAVARYTGGEWGAVRLAALPRLYEDFYARVADAGWSTPASRLAAVAERAPALELPEFDRIIVAGITASSVAETRILRALLDMDRCQFVAHRGVHLDTLLQPLGIEAPPFELPSLAHVRLCAAPGVHMQAAGLAAALRASLETRPETEDTVVVVPCSDSLFPVIRAVSAVAGEEQVNVSLGYPLDRTPAHGFVDALLDAAAAARGPMPAALYLRFALHPYTKNLRIAGGDEAARILFHSIEEHAAGTAGWRFTLEELERSAVLDAAAERVRGVWPDVERRDLEAHLRQVHDRLLRPFAHAADAAGAADALAEALLFIDTHSSARRHPYFRPFAARMLEALDALRRSRLGAWTFDDPAELAAFLRACLEGLTHNFPGTPLRGVQILGRQEVRGLGFRRVFALDMVEQHVPGGEEEDLLLPVALRRDLGIPTAAVLAHAAEYDVLTLLASADEAHLFLPSGPGQEASRIVERVLWEREKRAGSVHRAAHLGAVEHRVDLANPAPEPVPKFPGLAERLRARPFSAHSLRTYLACGRRYHFRYVLGLEERVAADGASPDLHIGTLLHEALRVYHEAHRDRVVSAEELRGEDIRAIVTELYDARSGGRTEGAELLQRIEMERRLASFVERYERRVAAGDGLRIVALEQRLRVDDAEGFALYGTIDRIDRRGDRYVISDYKKGRLQRNAQQFSCEKLTGAHPDKARRELANILQLGLYVLLFSGATGTDVECVDAQILALGVRDDNAVDVPLQCRDADAAEGMRVFDAALRGLIREILDEGTPFLPPARLGTACPDCPYRTICGTHWVRGRSAG